MVDAKQMKAKYLSFALGDLTPVDAKWQASFY